MIPETMEDPTTPVPSHDSYPEERLKNMNSPDGTAVTYQCTPHNSDPSVLYDNDCADFVLPEIEEDDCDEDDETNISGVSRMSAAFIQFAPSMVVENQSDLAAHGMNTISAPNQPNFVHCVTSVNFLVDPEQVAPISISMPTQISVNSRKVSVHKVKNKVDRVQNAIIAEPPAFIQEAQTYKPKMTDENELFSVRSEANRRSSGSSSRGNNQFRRVPSQGLPAIKSMPPSVAEPVPGKDSIPMGSSHTHAPMRIQSAQPSQGSLFNHSSSQVSMQLQSMQSNRPKEQDRSDQSVSSDSSRRSQLSRVSAPPTTPYSGGDPRRYENNSQFLPNHLQIQPKPSKVSGKKEKKGLFGKLFSNQVQADFDDVQLLMLQAEGADGARRVTASRLTENYGIDREEIIEEFSCGRHVPHPPSGSASVQSSHSTESRATNRSKESKLRILSNHVQADYDLSSDEGNIPPAIEVNFSNMPNVGQLSSGNAPDVKNRKGNKNMSNLLKRKS
jgi:hypothetical protein